MDQIRVICLDAVVKDGDNDPFPSISSFPGTLHVHIITIFGPASLQARKKIGIVSKVSEEEPRDEKENSLHSFSIHFSNFLLVSQLPATDPTH